MIVCKYKFDKSIYENFIPVFNDGYEGYTYTDEIDSENSNHMIRTIECDTLPTYIKFGDSDGMNFSPQRNSLLELIYLNTINIKNMSDMFAQCINLTSINTEGWDTSNVINMRTVFYACKKLTSLDISNFNTSNVTSMYAMFYNCTNLTSLDVSNFDTSKANNMGSMFSGCTNLTSLDISNFNTSSITNMSSMFYNCNNLTSLDVSNFDTNNVTSMKEMFYGCKNLTILDVSNFNTSKATDMAGMFRGCKILTSLNVSNWDTSKVTDMSAMFMECSCVLNLNLSNFNTSKVTTMRSMFQNCQSLTSLDISNWDTSNVTDMAGMFGNCKRLPMLNLLNIDATLAKTDNALHYLVDMNTLHTLILGEKSLCDSITTWNGMIDAKSFPVLEKLICPNADYINKLAEYLPDRSSELNSGVIVTNATISDEAMSTITAKNWSLRKMVAQYKYDANTYENLIPEFNTEFSSDKYEIYDSISEIVIDNIKWIDGYLNNSDIVNPSDTIVYSKYYTVQPNTKYVMEYGLNCHLYDENKIMIERLSSANEFTTTLNAKYVRFCKTKNNNTDTVIAKLITRSIESKNGDLPSIIKFGLDNETINSTDRELSLKEVIDLNTGNLNTGRRMFAYCRRVEKINSSNWDTSNMTSMYDMFVSCSKLTSLDVSNFNTSKVTSMDYTFCDCASLTSLDVSNFNTSKVTSMQSMFYGCNNLTSLDVSNFDTSKVTNMAYMFYKCRKLTSLDLSNWVTSKVNNMREMFYECNALSQINQTNLVTSALLSTNRMFYGCNKLTTLDVSNWDTSNVTDMGNMFLACYLLTELDVSNWVTSNVTNMGSMFNGCQSLTSLDVSNFNTSNATNMYAMFYNCNKLTSLNVSNFNTSNVTDMSYMFSGCQVVTLLDVSNFDTSNVTNMQSMFGGCEKVQSLDISKFNTSKVTTMNKMFHHCYSLTELDVSNWDTSNVNSLGLMFSGSDSTKMKLTKIVGIESLNTSNVTDFSAVFNDCSYLTRLDLSKWDFSKGLYYGNMMEGALSLVILDLGNFIVAEDKGTTYQYFLTEASKLKYVRCNNLDAISFLIDWLPTRTTDDIGIMLTNVSLDTIPSDVTDALTAKNWTVVSSDTLTKVAEYVYDSNTWNSIIPEFNNEFVEYFIDDVKDENGLVTRTISSIGGLPTLMRFGRTQINGESTTDNRTDSLLKILDMNTSGLTSCDSMFRFNKNLTSINCKWDTSNVTNMRSMFNTCLSLTSLDLSNFDTSNVTNMIYMFHGCNNLTSLEVSNFDTCKVTSMECIFYNCNNLTSLDLSNFDTSKVTSMDYMFYNTSKLSDIGMLYCTPSTINTIASALPTTHTQTIWVQDTKPSECTVVSGVEFKEYKENSIMINLNSPLLQGDKIEVKDGKLCHYHKMGMVVLNGSEGWVLGNNDLNTTARFTVKLDIKSKGTTTDDNYIGAKSYSDNFICDNKTTYGIDEERYQLGNNNIGIIYIRINKSKLSTTDVNGFKQWLQANPTTVVYELTEPYYEDITPLQSDITLETYLECNLDIYTDLPIKTNLTYLTNITNTSSIEEEINTINEGTDLTNLLEDEINN